MKYIDGILYLEFSEMTDAGIPNDTIIKAKQRSSSSWMFSKDPEDKRRLLVRYDTLKGNYKETIQDHFGDPYQFMADQVIRRFLALKTEDKDHIDGVKVNGKLLSEDKRKQYYEACRYLNMLTELTNDQIHGLGYHSVTHDFYPAVLRMIKTRKICLPTRYMTLKRKLKEYREQGARAVVNGRLGNANSRKVDELGQAMLKELLARHNNYNAEQIAIIYNNKARERGYKEVTAKTVLNYAMGLEIIAGRSGTGTWRNLFDRVIHRSRPTRPGMLWVGDATPYELYYQKTLTKDNGHIERKYWLRKVVYVVIDAFNDLVVGYSIGDTESADLARLAWKNATLNTGIMPDQVKVDHFGIKELTPMYEKLALDSDYFTPAAVGNARDKVVESFFARIYDQVTRMHPNASGRNITAKEKPNRDQLDRIKHEFPDEEGVIRMIEFDLMAWNTIQRRQLNNKSLMEQWTQADHSQVRRLTDYHYLDIFGARHAYTNKLTARGLQVSIGGVTRTYFSNDIELYKTIGTSYEVYYDEDNLSSILIKADEGRLQFVLPQEEKIPMAFGDFKEGDRKRLNTRLSFKKEVVNLVRQKEQERRQLLAEHGILSELEADAIAKTMFTVNGHQKNLLYQAQNVLKGDVPSNEPQVDDLYDDELPVPVSKKKQDEFDDGY